MSYECGLLPIFALRYSVKRNLKIYSQINYSILYGYLGIMFRSAP